jgi:hypothetical protein
MHLELQSIIGRSSGGRGGGIKRTKNIMKGKSIPPKKIFTKANKKIIDLLFFILSVTITSI